VVLQLVGEGALSLDDTVEQHLPGVVAGNGDDGQRHHSPPPAAAHERHPQR
jgi:CubicO group peptidase (beta-lactamase class C family)